VENGSEMQVWAKPRASRSEVLSISDSSHGEALEVRLAAPPAKGAANDELVSLLARALRIPRRDIGLVKGASGRLKRVRIQGLAPEEVAARLLGRRASRFWPPL
jgi:uncharacterized protein